MGVDEELRKAIRTGEVVIGSNETLDATKSGKSKLVTLSTTCPRDVERKIRKYTKEQEIPLYQYKAGAKDLGLALGKPFSVAMMAVIDTGESNVLEFGEVISGD